jgi:hypothetical protein
VRAVESGRWSDGAEADSPELLRGEEPTSRMFEDAELWVSVYSELLGFLAGLPEDGVFDRTIKRYRGRLSFWQRRLDELSTDGEVDRRGGSGSVG